MPASPSRTSSLSVTVFCFASFGWSAAGAEVPTGAPEELPPIFAPRNEFDGAQVSSRTMPENPVKPRSRMISPELAAKISSVIVRPKSPDLRGASTAMAPLLIEDPRVVRLERYVVRELRLPQFKDRELLTPKGKAALARHRYPGAGSAALAMLEEDFANERRQEAAELTGLAELAGTTLPRDVKSLMKDAALRRGEFRPTFGLRK